MVFPSQEYWSGLPFPSPGNLPVLRIQPVSPALQVDSLLLSHQGHPVFKDSTSKYRLWEEAPGRQVYWQALHSSSITTFNSKLNGFRTKGFYGSFVNFMH